MSQTILLFGQEDKMEEIQSNESKRPWKRQRILKKQDIPPQEAILAMARSYSSLKERSLFILAYLTAGRISEIVKQPYLRKHTYAYEEINDKNGQKVLRIKRNENGSPIITQTERIRWDYPGIRRKDIVVQAKKDKRVLIVSMQNRKNKQHTRKNVPIPAEKEAEFIDMLNEYLDTLREDQPLFDFGVAKAERIIAKTDMNPHFLRDIRLTHMVTLYDFNAFQLVKFAGWKDIKPAERYVRLGIGDLIDKY